MQPWVQELRFLRGILYQTGRPLCLHHAWVRRWWYSTGPAPSYGRPICFARDTAFPRPSANVIALALYRRYYTLPVLYAGVYIGKYCKPRWFQLCQPRERFSGRVSPLKARTYNARIVSYRLVVAGCGDRTRIPGYSLPQVGRRQSGRITRKGMYGYIAVDILFIRKLQ